MDFFFFFSIRLLTWEEPFLSPDLLRFCSFCLKYSLLLTLTHPTGLRLKVTFCPDSWRLGLMPCSGLLTVPYISLTVRPLTFHCFPNVLFSPAILYHPCLQDPRLSVLAPAITVLGAQLATKKYYSSKIICGHCWQREISNLNLFLNSELQLFNSLKL